MARRFVIHIGANKAASSTFQDHLFARHSGLHYLGEDGEGYESYRDLVDSMVSDDDLYFQHEACAQFFEKHRTLDAGKTLLYSSEDVMTSRAPMACARRLHEFLPDARILLVIRNQLTAIPSFYANHGAFLKPAPPSHFRRFVSFHDWMQYCTMFIKYGPLASYDYARFVNLYAALFGEDRIDILLFEEFLNDQHAFLDKLCAVLEIDMEEATRLVHTGHRRKRRSRRAYHYHRLRSRVLWGVPLAQRIPGGAFVARQFRKFLRGGEPVDGFQSERWMKWITEYYAAGNAALAERFNLPIRDHGYPLTESKPDAESPSALSPHRKRMVG